MALKYARLSDELQQQIKKDRVEHWENPWRCADDRVVRRDMSHDTPNLWRPAFLRDIEKIMHLPYYNRYTDKTQVFSFYHNDDISHRALHVQLVSRIARNIGAVLGLNLDLIEAIALGHDLGHTPFGHAGERFLDELLYENAKMHFNHNVQSARVLDALFSRNVSLQTLDGILCHNGEFEQQEYRPIASLTFEEHDQRMTDCLVQGGSAIHSLVPFTLEACVVRISDMIAYLGKDRQDARIANIIPNTDGFSKLNIGTENAEIINNLIVDIIENSYRKPYLLLSSQVYADLKTAKEENYRLIYQNEKVDEQYRAQIRPMFKAVYEKLLADVEKKNKESVIYNHHIQFIRQHTRYYAEAEYEKQNPNMIVADYIASMTDDYFMDLYHHLFPNSSVEIVRHSYFE